MTGVQTCALPIYRTDFKSHANEYVRITILADVIRHAERRVLAYTYADPVYLMRFWREKTNNVIRDYYEAHAQTLAKHRNNPQFLLKRAFVVPDDLEEKHPDAFCVLVDVISTLRSLGMTHLYYIQDKQARAEFVDSAPFPLRSFLFSDDTFLSEGESIQLQEQPAYCVFTTVREDVEGFENTFIMLEQAARHELTPNDINRLVERAKRCGP